MKWLVIGYICWQVFRLICLSLFVRTASRKSQAERMMMYAKQYEFMADCRKMKAAVFQKCGFTNLSEWFKTNSAAHQLISDNLKDESSKDEGAG